MSATIYMSGSFLPFINSLPYLEFGNAACKKYGTGSVSKDGLLFLACE